MPRFEALHLLKRRMLMNMSAETNLSQMTIVHIIYDLFHIAITELRTHGKHHFIGMVRMKYTPPEPGRQGMHIRTKKVIDIRAKKASLKLFTLRKFKMCLADILECHWLP